MKTKLLFSVLVFFITSSALGVITTTAQDSILPGSEITQPTGTAEGYLSQTQSAKENLITMQQAIEAASSGFVTRSGTGLVLNGQTYKFSLANNYYLFYKSQTMIDEIFADAASLGLNVIRTWGFCDGMYKEGVSFQPSAGVYDESGFRKMDYILYKAAQSNMKIIIPFVNNWDDFGGMNQYVKWYLGTSPSTSEHDLFFTNDTIKGWYKSYVTYFLNSITY